jgi:dTDP-4-dehydrorhamnose reductase
LKPDKTVWITGAQGLIGSHLVRAVPTHPPTHLLAHSFTPRPLTCHDLDLTDFPAVRRAFQQDRPQLIIHCTAISKSTACQTDPALARKVNVEATAELAGLAADIPFIFFSTDLVFDGRQGDYAETDAVNPLSIYAETKVAAERIVLQNPKHTVIRTSLNGGISPTGDRGFNEEIRRAWEQGRALTFFTDEFRCPIPVVATARAVWELVARNQPGLYHLAGAERLSRWQIAQLLAARWPELHPKLESGSLKDYHGAPRSPDTSLSSAKIQKLLNFPLPGLTEWLDANLNEPF